MNKDELKGKAENLKGRVKEAAGSLFGDKKKEGEGFIERVRGAVREKMGKAKEEVHRDAPSEGGSASRQDRSVSRQEDDDE
ncbi:MAG TPA: CsbD family protein [Polyangia bacterium]|jgi:uncharacterized protein YjbJ (UPF0337 family)